MSHTHYLFVLQGQQFANALQREQREANSANHSVR